MTNKKIVITGATGFIGQKLTLELFKKGYDIHVLTRDPKKAQNGLSLPLTYHSWNGKEEVSIDILENTYAIIHLAGESIAQRWSDKIKKEIYESRVIGTKALLANIEKLQNKPQILIGTSAIGFYGDRKDELLTEESNPTDSYLSHVCRDWEKSYECNISRKVIIRVGVVLGQNGGALEQMLPPFRMGVGGPLGNGKQWMSWIHLDDLVNLYLFSLENNNIQGIINGTSPKPVSNKELTKVLGQLLHRPAFIPVPTFSLKILFGEMSVILLSSQNVMPRKALEAGFQFKFKTIQEALIDLISPLNETGAHVFEATQWVPFSKEDTFSFFSQAQNLEKITPPWLHFHIRDMSTDKIEKNSLIRYRLRVKGFPIFWKTIIKEWNPDHSFVDFQLSGPYKLWHHTHHFESIANGTLMTDRVVYKVPLPFIGDIMNLLMIRGDIQTIFNYRKQTVSQLILQK